MPIHILLWFVVLMYVDMCNLIIVDCLEAPDPVGPNVMAMVEEVEVDVALLEAELHQVRVNRSDGGDAGDEDLLVEVGVFPVQQQLVLLPEGQPPLLVLILVLAVTTPMSGNDVGDAHALDNLECHCLAGVSDAHPHLPVSTTPIITITITITITDTSILSSTITITNTSIVSSASTETTLPIG